ncbi:CoxG family protein [Bacillus piscicola]|uniref:CoxG family protein n=1 Tax=Bacillus piscicola TaxID=1632684 RepID=UPI001F098115|nr:carbon monoxide dehydrogenase subunit G [Bacillus piscicola]
MNISSSHKFKGISKETLWNTLQNNEALKNALPGCQKFEEVEENVYDSELGINIGPVKGVFTAKVSQVDIKEMDSYRLLVEGQGKPGKFNGDAAMELVEDGDDTTLQCSADVEVTGVLAAAGQRVMNGVAKVIMGQFFKDIEKEAKKIASL